MSHIIAITGKGGVGKTTLSALLVSRLVSRGLGPVLAIDADPNSCLDAALGVKATVTVGSAREDVRREASEAQASGISKTELLQMKIAESLVEADGFDLIAMGRPEGAGCYCYANSVLKSVIAELAAGYPYVVLDNEAGLENLSRRIVATVDALALVSDGSGAGLATLTRLYDLAKEMETGYKQLYLVLNRLRHGCDPARIEQIRAYTKADAVFLLPEDADVADAAERSLPLAGLAAGNPVVARIDGMIDLLAGM